MPDLDVFAPDLRALAVPIGDLQPYPDNPRRGNVNVIIDSLVTFGQQAPVVVQKSTGYIVAGNHVYQAALRLEWSHLAAVYVELDDQEAAAYLLADNRLSDLAVYDRSALTALLRDLDSSDALGGTGFSREELNALLLDDAASGGEVPGNVGQGREGDGEVAASWDGPELRQVVLLMPIAKAEEFLRWTAHLRGTYGTSSVVSTILRAIDLQAAAVRS